MGYGTHRVPAVFHIRCPLCLKHRGMPAPNCVVTVVAHSRRHKMLLEWLSPRWASPLSRQSPGSITSLAFKPSKQRPLDKPMSLDSLSRPELHQRFPAPNVTFPSLLPRLASKLPNRGIKRKRYGPRHRHFTLMKTKETAFLYSSPFP